MLSGFPSNFLNLSIGIFGDDPLGQKDKYVMLNFAHRDTNELINIGLSPQEFKNVYIAMSNFIKNKR